jgi:hypothetical protein
MTTQVITPAEAMKEIERRRQENIANNHWIMDLQQENAKLRLKAEVWEEIERLKISVEYNRFGGKWYAITAHAQPWDIGSGATAMEAVTELLSRIAATKAEAANASV